MGAMAWIWSCPWFRKKSKYDITYVVNVESDEGRSIKLQIIN